MKRLAVIIATWLAVCAPPAATAAAAEPADAALGFLEALKATDGAASDLLKESFLSQHVGPAKKRVITQRLNRLGRHLRRGSYEFDVLGEKRDGDFAAVLVSAINESDPLDVDLHAVALGKAGEQWRVAPVPGSFENSSVRIDDAVEARTEALELWMGRERIFQLRELQAAVEREFRERMAKAVPPAMLEKASPKQVVKMFIESALSRNLPAAMVLLGRLDSEATDDDREIQRVVSRGLQGLDRRGHWRLLTSPGVVRVVVQEDPGDDLDAEVLVLVLDPADSAGPNLLRFVLLRSGKRWQIELPASLKLADAERLRFQRAVWRERDGDDADLRKQFHAFFEKEFTSLRVESLDEAGAAIEKVLREGSLEDFLRYLHRDDALTEGERRVAYAELGQFWNTFHEGAKAAADGELVEVIGHGDAAVLVFHVVSTAQLDRLKLKPLVLLKGEDGWGIAPGVTTAGNFEALAKTMRKDQNEAIGKFIDQRPELTKKAAERFLKRFAKAIPKPGVIADPAKAAAVVKNFRDLLREGKLLEAFELCALLDSSEGAWEALKSLSYEYRGALQSTQPDVEVGKEAKGHWAAVSLRVDSGASAVPDFPMYLLVATEEGPRIVVDVGLRLATNKGREVLNKRVWTRIEDQVEEKQSALVRTLFEGHVTRCRKDLDAWEKSNKSSP